MSAKKFIDYLELIISRVIIFVIRLFPYKSIPFFSYLFTFLIYPFAGRSRKTIRKNLKIGYAESLSYQQLKLFSRSIFVNFFKTIFEFLHYRQGLNSRLVTKLKFENIEAMDRALLKGRGAIALTGHFGNWEFLGAGIALSGKKLHSIVRPLDNSYLDKEVERLRLKNGMQIIPRGVGVKKVVQALKNNGVIGMLADQNSARHGIFVPLFGKLAATVKGPAAIALKYKAAVIPCYARREKDGTHTLVFKDELELLQGKDEEDTLRLNVAMFNRVYEEIIKENPTQWLWFHDRWKTQPGK